MNLKKPGTVIVATLALGSGLLAMANAQENTTKALAPAKEKVVYDASVLEPTHKNVSYGAHAFGLSSFDEFLANDLDTKTKSL